MHDIFYLRRRITTRTFKVYRQVDGSLRIVVDLSLLQAAIAERIRAGGGAMTVTGHGENVFGELDQNASLPIASGLVLGRIRVSGGAKVYTRTVFIRGAASVDGMDIAGAELTRASILLPTEVVTDFGRTEKLTVEAPAGYFGAIRVMSQTDFGESARFAVEAAVSNPNGIGAKASPTLSGAILGGFCETYRVSYLEADGSMSVGDVRLRGTVETYRTVHKEVDGPLPIGNVRLGGSCETYTVTYLEIDGSMPIGKITLAGSSEAYTVSYLEIGGALSAEGPVLAGYIEELPVGTGGRLVIPEPTLRGSLLRYGEEDMCAGATVSGEIEIAGLLETAYAYSVEAVESGGLCYTITANEELVRREGGIVMIGGNT